MDLNEISSVFAAVVFRKRSGQRIPVLHDNRGVRQSAVHADADYPHTAANIQTGPDPLQIDVLGN